VGKPPSDADQLYGLPLREFTRARAALVTRLHEAGQLDEAAHVKTLPRPSLPVWAINQVARADRIGVERLVRAVEAVKRGQLGEGGPVAPRSRFNRQRCVPCANGPPTSSRLTA
jgi:hypothetical protein